MRLRVAMLTGSRLLAAALQAVALIVVARGAPIAEFGSFSVVFAVQATVFTIGALGLQGFILRESAKRQAPLVRGAMRLNTLSSFIACAVAVAISLWARPDAEALVVLALASAFLFEKNAGVRQSVLVADQRMVLVAVSVSIVPSMVLFALLTAPAALDPVVVYAIGRLGGGLLSWLAVLRAPRALAGGEGATSIRTTLERVWPLAVNGVVTTTVTFDTAIVGGVGGAVQAAFYSAATKIIAPLAIATSSISTVLMPYVAVMDASRARALHRSIVRLGCLFVVLIVPVSLLAPPVTGLLFGPSYASAGHVLMVLIWAVPSLTVGPLLETYLQAAGRERFVAGIAVGSSAAALMGALLGTLVLGALGAALSVAVLNTAKVVVLALVRPDLRGSEARPDEADEADVSAAAQLREPVR